jgi:hypothetical protein
MFAVLGRFDSANAEEEECQGYDEAQTEAEASDTDADVLVVAFEGDEPNHARQDET